MNKVTPEKQLSELRAIVRKYLIETLDVPYRAVDCDQRRVELLREKMERASGLRI